MGRLKNTFIRTGVRIFFPGIAKNLEEERVFEVIEAGDDVDLERYISVEDHGAPVTVICFAGMAVLYAAMPRFEFRKTLQESGRDFNFIWVRDPHRCWYRRAPDGSGKGFQFYSEIIQEALDKLPSKHTIAVGASAGGAIAFLLSASLPINQIVAFNPVFPLEVYCSAASRRRVLFDVKKLLRNFNAWFESVLVTFGTAFIWKRSENLDGLEETPATLAAWQNGAAPARTAVFYSTRNRPDTEQAEPLRSLDGIILTPVESERHNCMAELKSRGELGKVIVAEIDASLAARKQQP
jgi:hypothetical protein